MLVGRLLHEFGPETANARVECAQAETTVSK